MRVKSVSSSSFSYSPSKKNKNVVKMSPNATSVSFQANIIIILLAYSNYDFLRDIFFNKIKKMKQKVFHRHDDTITFLIFFLFFSTKVLINNPTNILFVSCSI
jgi:hypothetical protein